jgi:hypothetical protein
MIVVFSNRMRDAIKLKTYRRLFRRADQIRSRFGFTLCLIPRRRMNHVPSCYKQKICKSICLRLDRIRFDWTSCSRPCLPAPNWVMWDFGVDKRIIHLITSYLSFALMRAEGLQSGSSGIATNSDGQSVGRKYITS